MIKKILILLFFTLLIPQPLFAQSHFSTNHKVYYKVNENLKTTVNHEIKINYKDKYNGLQNINFREPVSDISNLKLTSQSNNYKISSSENTVNVEFNSLLIGEGSQSISYTYETQNLFQKVGTTYNLNVPKIEGSENINEFNLQIELSDKLNISSDIKDYSKNSKKILSFNKEELNNFAKNITIGTEMYYEVVVNYLVDKNKNYIVQIPNIPDRQRVYTKSISKKPNYAQKDDNGNNLFFYSPEKPQKIKVTYVVRVYGNKAKNYQNNTDLYLRNVKNWNYETGVPAYFVAENTKGQSRSLDVKNVYNFVKDYLEYGNEKVNYSVIERIGAENINKENKNNAVCLEYTDLTIAILRGMGIPAREVNGFAVENNSFNSTQLHSWVEYLNDNNHWVQIDPTWGDTSEENYVTSFDLYHINFLIRGVNSEYPTLPGSYSTNKQSESVKVNILGTKPETKVVELEKASLGPVAIVRNNAPNDLNVIGPYELKIVLGDLGITSESLYELKINEVGIMTILSEYKSTLYIIVFTLIGSIVLFYSFHQMLNLESVKEKKDKITSLR